MSDRRRRLRLALVLVAVAVAALSRVRAVRALPPDYDELDYVPLGFEYARAWDEQGLRGLAGVTRNAEHPALVKVLHGAVLRAARAPEFDASTLEVGKPMPPAARPAFEATRALSAVAGVAQALLVAGVAPAGGLWLAVDTYHVKYTSQAYLEAIPGLLALVAVLLFERATRRGAGAAAGERAGPSPAPLLLSAAALGLSAAGKYPYPLVAGAALAPFLVARLRGRPLLLALYPLVALAVFLAGDPALWSDPPGRLWGSLAFHWRFSSGEYVRRAGLPWWWALHWLTRPAPAAWHPGVFRVAFPDHALLVVGLASAPIAAARRPVWVAWALAGLVFLLVWPTKWPQYTLLVRTPLAAMAGMGIGAALGRLRLSGRASAPRLPP